MKLDITINELMPGGEGCAITELNGERRAVFVSGVAPGEEVRVEIDPKQRPARGTLLEILKASPDRVTPACAHVERCGGCDWMHLTSDAQLAAHREIVARLLGVEVTSHPAPKSLAYRSRTRVHVEAKRGRLVVGMYGRRTHEPVAVDTCVVLDPALDRVRRDLTSYLEGATGRGEAALALGVDRKPVIELHWNADLPAETFGRLERAVNAKEIAGARLFSGAVSTPATIGDPTPFIVGADGELLRLAPGGFSQATEEGNAFLAERVAALAVGDPAVELYAGAGNLTVLLARGRELIAVESNKDACSAARANLAARSLKAKVVEADASTFAIPRPTRLLVLDPPREGARGACEAIAKTKGKLRSIVYVSCDPPTLARDVRTLVEAGFKVERAETFEMFPHTSHVETVVVLARSD